MKVPFLLFSLLLFTAPLAASDEVTITVKVTNIPGAKGDLLVGLYDSPASFTKKPVRSSPKVTLTSAADVVVKLTNVKPGRYAIAVIQDLNQNGKLDTNLFGMPQEPLAFSVISEIPRGKPRFEDCAFEVKDRDIELSIALTLE